MWLGFFRKSFARVAVGSVLIIPCVMVDRLAGGLGGTRPREDHHLTLTRNYRFKLVLTNHDRRQLKTSYEHVVQSHLHFPLLLI
jgi:hypothetical protein